MFTRILSKIAKAISKIWGLFKTTFFITLFSAIGFFLLLVFFQNATTNAVLFIKGIIGV